VAIFSILFKKDKHVSRKKDTFSKRSENLTSNRDTMALFSILIEKLTAQIEGGWTVYLNYLKN
jgi:hypothetical protein